MCRVLEDISVESLLHAAAAGNHSLLMPGGALICETFISAIHAQEKYILRRGEEMGVL